MLLRNDSGTFRGFNNVLSTQQKMTWFDTLRGRSAFHPLPPYYYYGTGGLAYGSMEEMANVNFVHRWIRDVQYPSTKSLTHNGWTAGAGVEWAFKQNWVSED